MILSRVFPSSPDTTGIRCDLHMIFCLLHMLFLLLAGFSCNTQDFGDLFWKFSRTRPEKQQKSTNAEWASAGDKIGSKQVPRGISYRREGPLESYGIDAQTAALEENWCIRLPVFLSAHVLRDDFEAAKSDDVDNGEGLSCCLGRTVIAIAV